MLMIGMYMTHAASLVTVVLATVIRVMGEAHAAGT